MESPRDPTQSHHDPTHSLQHLIHSLTDLMSSVTHLMSSVTHRRNFRTHLTSSVTHVINSLTHLTESLDAPSASRRTRMTTPVARTLLGSCREGAHLPFDACSSSVTALGNTSHTSTKPLCRNGRPATPRMLGRYSTSINVLLGECTGGTPRLLQ